MRLVALSEACLTLPEMSNVLKGGISREYLTAGYSQHSQCPTHSGAELWPAAFSKFTAGKFSNMTQEAWHTNMTQVTTASLPALTPLNPQPKPQAHVHLDKARLF